MVLILRRSSGSYLQTYAIARAAVEKKAAGLRPGSWAVIIDANETILNNSEWTLRGIIPDPMHPKGTWTDWVREERATALPGASEFIWAVHASGGNIVVVTNRDDSVCARTLSNFYTLGISVEGILCATDATGNKDPRFESVRDGTSRLKLPGFNVIAYLGDNIQDFPDKQQATPGSFDEFGKSLFILPNPVYGSWNHNELR